MSDGDGDGDGEAGGDPPDRSPLPDGTYDAIVVDADDAPDGGVTVHLAVLGGAHKGRVVELRSPDGGEALDLLAVPATITVAGGTPTVHLEP